jgi:glycosyltransferase involved in cell wall biosynthesis
VIPNFIPDDLVDDSPYDRGGHLLFAGDLTPDKGVGTLLEAHGAVGSLPRLLLVGRDAGALPPELPDGIEALGPRAHEEVTELMRKASVVVVPSIVGDACPTVVLEAMAAGRPVVASATGGIVDLVEDGVTGLLVAPGDAEALGAALKSLATEPERAEALGAAGRRRASESFTASAVKDRLEAVYLEAIRTFRE